MIPNIDPITLVERAIDNAIAKAESALRGEHDPVAARDSLNALLPLARQPSMKASARIEPIQLAIQRLTDR